MEFNHIGVVCRSAENSDRFYADIMGLEKRRERVVPAAIIATIFGINQDVKIIDYGNDAFLIEVFVVDHTPPKQKVAHCCIELADRDAFVEKCAANGLPVIEVAKGDGGKIVFVDDFDGNRYEVKETVK
ncbi:MAG: hypothetical protein DRH32_08005 [Deltaproteobacteria bacterium]|nr:MAG: hypothetical protein DRH32_08005 [Deltaproteobacteria bacterium]